MTRTLLLGIDGADPALMDEFEVPNMQSIGDGFQIQTFGNSGPSWVSVLTGRAPSEHGVRKLKPQQNVQTWEGTPLWKKIDGYCGVLNVPLTYPPDRDIDGWLVSGLMTPRNAIYTSPRDLYKELDEIGYRVDMWVDKHSNHPHGHYGTVPFDFTQEYREELLGELEDVIAKRGDGICWLLDNEPVDFAFPCFTSLDRVQHLAFHDQDTVEKFYGLVDEQVGRILDRVSDDTDVFLTSDHGFQRVDIPDSDIEGEHRVMGYGSTNTGREFADLLELHEQVVASANRTDVEDRLRDLGYIE